MTAKPPPANLSPTIRAMLIVAKEQERNAYELARATGLGLHTLQRFLAGEGSPTIDTVERIAKELGMTIKAEKR